ncbi:glucosaminidase domain-containing protein [Colwelliaceae bacterium 6471]
MKTTLLVKIPLIALFAFALVAPFIFKFSETVKLDDNAIQGDKIVEPEKPLHTVKLPKFAHIRDVKEKKRQFFNFIRPAIEQENGKISRERQSIAQIQDKISLEEPLSEEDISVLNALVKKYKVSKKYSLLQQLDELLNRIDIIPASLVLVQAANESAWGTSRFARIGLNFFGIWCYRQGCGMVPNSRDSGANHEVAAFDSVNAAVKRYLYNINTHNAYDVFRVIRAQLREQNQPLSPQVLATGLLAYSERGSDYVIEITDMIRHNKEYLTPRIAD